MKDLKIFVQVQTTPWKDLIKQLKNAIQTGKKWNS